MPPIGVISTYESGVDVIVEWKFKNFSTFSERDGARYLSPSFSFGGEKWFLRILPNGSSKHDSYGHVGLSLCKCNSDRSIKQSFSLSIKTVTGETYNEEHFTKDFGKTSENCHDLLRFIPKSELSRRRSELVPYGVQTVVYTMKNTTSAASASNSASAEICASASDSAKCSSDSGKCCHCKQSFANGSLSSHRRKFMQRLIKCPDCLEIVLRQKWLDEQECQQERLEGVQSLYEGYKNVLFGGRHQDLILKFGDKELRAHRDILSARSRVFKSILDHDMKEKNSGIIDVTDCDPNAMELFLSYIYCGKIEPLRHNNMLGLYYIADKYEMMELKRECCNFIKRSLSLINICSVIQLALKHTDSDLLEYATGYFSDNVLDIMQTVEWQTFLKDNSTVGNELLMKSIKKLKNAET